VPRNTSPRRRVVDLQATAPSPTPTRRTLRRVAGRAPPRPRPPARSEENSARRRAADLAALPKTTSHVAGLQTSPRFAPSHTPTRTGENFATRPPLDHSDARGGTPCRDAGLQTSQPRRPLAHVDACGGTPRRDAGLQTSRLRRQSARKMPRKPPLGLPHQQTGFEREEANSHRGGVIHIGIMAQTVNR